METEIIFKDIPDKREEKNTTSYQFKRDLLNFLGDKYKDKICLEIGAHKGYSSRILSESFKKVITCENDIDYVNFSKQLNKDKNNIDILQKDVYGTKWDFENIDVVFIDCNHEINHVLSDTRNAINLCGDNQELLLIFDDYGLDNPWEGVKEAIQKYVNTPGFSILKKIGHEKGWEYRDNKFLKDREGIICKYTKEMMWWEAQDEY